MKVDFANECWGADYKDGGETTCYIDSLSLGNQHDNKSGGNVNHRFVFRCKQPKDCQAPPDPNDSENVDNDPYPPEDDSFLYWDMKYEHVLKYVDKKQDGFEARHLPTKSLVTYEIQVRIDHEPSKVFKQLSHVIRTVHQASNSIKQQVQVRIEDRLYHQVCHITRDSFSIPSVPSNLNRLPKKQRRQRYEQI